MSPKDTPVRKAINCIARAVICRAAKQRLISRETSARLSQQRASSIFLAFRQWIGSGQHILLSLLWSKATYLSAALLLPQRWYGPLSVSRIFHIAIPVTDPSNLQIWLIELSRYPFICQSAALNGIASVCCTRCHASDGSYVQNWPHIRASPRRSFLVGRLAAVIPVPRLDGIHYRSITCREREQSTCPAPWVNKSRGF